MFCKRKLKEVEAERDKLRAEKEEYRTLAELLGKDANRNERRVLELEAEIKRLRIKIASEEG